MGASPAPAPRQLYHSTVGTLGCDAALRGGAAWEQCPYASATSSFFIQHGDRFPSMIFLFVWKRQQRRHRNVHLLFFAPPGMSHQLKHIALGRQVRCMGLDIDFFHCVWQFFEEKRIKTRQIMHEVYQQGGPVALAA